MNLSQGELIATITKTLPYPDQIKAFDLSEEGCVRFTWRGHTFRVSQTGHTEEVIGGMLHGNNLALLLRAVIKPAVVETLMGRA